MLHYKSRSAYTVWFYFWSICIRQLLWFAILLSNSMFTERASNIRWDLRFSRRQILRWLSSGLWAVIAVMMEAVSSSETLCYTLSIVWIGSTSVFRRLVAITLTLPKLRVYQIYVRRWAMSSIVFLWWIDHCHKRLENNLKHWSISIRLHGATSQKTVIWILCWLQIG
jgi:hypothetical protein